MTRRLALAVALAFTTVVTFAMVAIGAQAGLFGGGSDGAPADAAAGEATPTPEPTVITEYIYIDQTVTPIPAGELSQGSSGGAEDSRDEVRAGEDGDSEEIEEHEDAHEDEHHESEHEEDDD